MRYTNQTGSPLLVRLGDRGHTFIPQAAGASRHRKHTFTPDTTAGTQITSTTIRTRNDTDGPHRNPHPHESIPGGNRDHGRSRLRSSRNSRNLRGLRYRSAGTTEVVGADRSAAGGDRFAGTVIDASGKLVDGTPVNSPADLRQALMKRPEQFVQTMTEKLMTYALGRSVEYYDMPAVRAIVRNAARDNYRLSSIVLGIVRSAPFQKSRASSSELPASSAALR